MLGVIFGLIICGVLVSLVTGMVENPHGVSIIGATYYGHPLVWRVVRSIIDNATDFRFINFLIDTNKQSTPKNCFPYTQRTRSYSRE